MDAHCEACAAYETALMSRAPGEPAPDVRPCDDYVMTPAFQEWLVASMRREVFGEGGGLAILAARPGPRGSEEQPDEAAQDHEA